MLSKEKLRKIIIQRIEENEIIGESSGGSGHLSYVSYEINSIGDFQKSGDGWKVSYTYTKYIESEFTYYPDNPPHEYKISKSLIFNKMFEIINELENDAD